MSAVLPVDDSFQYIRQKVRRLTASASESALSNADLDQYIQRAYNSDFPYAIKIDQTRSVYRLFTIPNVDRYPTDANNNQGYRAPVYIEGVQGNFFKDRQQFFNLYPRYPTQMQVSVETVSGTITGVTKIALQDVIITSVAHGLLTGATITINGVLGTTELNGNTYTVTVLGANTFTLDGTAAQTFSAYISGGTWFSDTSYSFNLFGNANNPFPQANFGILSTSIVIGGIDVNGDPIRITDDGGGVIDNTPDIGTGSNTTIGQLIFINTDNVGNNVSFTASVPTASQAGLPPLSPIPGPSPIVTNPPEYVGEVNYISSQFEFTLPVPAKPGTMLNIWCNQYVTGRPYSVLFWNNEITIRPVPDNVYCIEIETFLTPTQFLTIADTPILRQWSQYLAYIAAMEVLRDRQDVDGVENLREGMMRQEALVLERQSVEEIFQPTYQLFNSTTSAGGYSAGMGWGGF